MRGYDGMSTARERLDEAVEALDDASRKMARCSQTYMPVTARRLCETTDSMVAAYNEARQEESVAPPAPASRATIILRDSSTPKRVRFARWYHKGGCLCVELAGVRDEDGRPVILEVPHEQYTYALRSHLPHLGMEEQE